MLCMRVKVLTLCAQTGGSSLHAVASSCCFTQLREGHWRAVLEITRYTMLTKANLTPVNCRALSAARNSRAIHNLSGHLAWRLWCMPLADLGAWQCAGVGSATVRMTPSLFNYLPAGAYQFECFTECLAIVWVLLSPVGAHAEHAGQTGQRNTFTARQQKPFPVR